MKAMLACSEIPDLDKLCYPVLATPKLDGIRAIASQGWAMSRTWKELPNKHVQELFKEHLPYNLDGELMVRKADGTLAPFDEVQSAIMSQHGKPNVEYWVFDSHSQNKSHLARTEHAERRVRDIDQPWVKYVEPTWIFSADEAREFATACLASGYEGIILRDPDAPYKLGRSTLKQGWMLKWKPFHDAEGIVVAHEELIHQDGTAGNKLGALWLEMNGVRFKVGTGFDDAQRVAYWAKRDKLIGQQVTFKYQELTKDKKPRFPVFKGFRLEEV